VLFVAPMPTRLFVLLVLVVGCTADPPALVHLEWGGQNGIVWAEGDQPSTRSGPVVPCPDWGSVGGPVTGIVAELSNADGTPVPQQVIACGAEPAAYSGNGDTAARSTSNSQMGTGTFDVPSGKGVLRLWEQLGGDGDGNVGRTDWIYAYDLEPGQMLELGYVDLDFSVWL
jgi:hypothetical protein